MERLRVSIDPVHSSEFTYSKNCPRPLWRKKVWQNTLVSGCPNVYNLCCFMYTSLSLHRKRVTTSKGRFSCPGGPSRASSKEHAC